jgi:hypothetical protein
MWFVMLIYLFCRFMQAALMLAQLFSVQGGIGRLFLGQDVTEFDSD